MTVLEADLTWTGTAFEAGVRVPIDAAGRIASPGGSAEEPVRRLRDRALLPGFVDAHSHAFQRGLRGRGERFPAGAGSFWTWRDAMYALVDSLGSRALRELTRQAFREMLAAGITTVGEFHYLHHEQDGAGWELDDCVLDAARETGIRLVLLQVYYRSGGFGQPLRGPQRRFDGRSLGAYWEQMDALAGRLDGTRESLGAAPHSLRAVGLEELSALHAEARGRGLVVHMHVEETRKELEDCRAVHGRTPLELLLEHLELDRGFTAVHCTHGEPAALSAFLERGASLCLCPLTEANLGDGIPRLPQRLPRDALALGTDSTARISMIEEMRWCELAQRLAREERGRLAGPDGDVSRTLLAAATSGGARSLGVDAGALEPGRWADLVELDLSSDELAGWTPDTLLDSLVFGASERSLAATWVGGKRVFERRSG